MLKALIVDDDKNVLNGLKTLIPWTALGYELVGVAANGRTGYELAMKHNPDVIISDIVMPEVNGTEFLKMVMTALSDVSFIFLSAYEDFPAAQLALKYHVQAYILKPIDMEKLQTIIEQLEQITARNGKERYYQTLLFGDPSAVKKALLQGDRAYLEKMFQKLLNDALKGIDDVGLIRRCCEQLVVLMGEVWGDAFALPAGVDIKRIKNKTDMIVSVADACYDFIDRRNNIVSQEHPMIPDICNFIDQNMAREDLGVALIARELNYSASYISRVFVRCVGVSATDYIAMKRMEAAAGRLCRPHASVAQVAKSVGYRNANYFAQVFKKTMGCAPSEYRQARREGRVK